MSTTVVLLDHTDPATAAAIHAIRMAAYAQEAALLRADPFPPLERTVEDVRADPAQHYGAHLDGMLAGVVSLACGEDVVDIESLVVAPACQRRGIGAALVRFSITHAGRRRLTVSTGVGNLPAVALYRSLGFAETGRRLVGPQPLEVAAFVRPPGQPA